MVKDLSHQRKADKDLITAAIQLLKAKGFDINPYTVADEASIPRSALYRNSELMDLIHQARGEAYQSSDMSVENLQLRVTELEERNRELEESIWNLEAQNETLAKEGQDAYNLGYQEGREEAIRKYGIRASGQFEVVQREIALEAGADILAMQAEATPTSALAEAEPVAEQPAVAEPEPISSAADTITPAAKEPVKEEAPQPEPEPPVPVVTAAAVPEPAAAPLATAVASEPAAPVPTPVPSEPTAPGPTAAASEPAAPVAATQAPEPEPPPAPVSAAPKPDTASRAAELSNAAQLFGLELHSGQDETQPIPANFAIIQGTAALGAKAFDSLQAEAPEPTPPPAAPAEPQSTPRSVETQPIRLDGLQPQITFEQSAQRAVEAAKEPQPVAPPQPAPAAQEPPAPAPAAQEPPAPVQPEPAPEPPAPVEPAPAKAAAQPVPVQPEAAPVAEAPPPAAAPVPEGLKPRALKPAAALPSWKDQLDFSSPEPDPPAIPLQSILAKVDEKSEAMDNGQPEPEPPAEMEKWEDLPSPVEELDAGLTEEAPIPEEIPNAQEERGYQPVGESFQLFEGLTPTASRSNRELQSDTGELLEGRTPPSSTPSTFEQVAVTLEQVAAQTAHGNGGRSAAAKRTADTGEMPAAIVPDVELRGQVGAQPLTATKSADGVFNIARSGPYVASTYNPLVELSWKDVETVYKLAASDLKDMSRQLPETSPKPELLIDPADEFKLPPAPTVLPPPPAFDPQALATPEPPPAAKSAESDEWAVPPSADPATLAAQQQNGLWGASPDQQAFWAPAAADQGLWGVSPSGTDSMWGTPNAQSNSVTSSSEWNTPAFGERSRATDSEWAKLEQNSNPVMNDFSQPASAGPEPAAPPAASEPQRTDRSYANYAYNEEEEPVEGVFDPGNERSFRDPDGLFVDESLTGSDFVDNSLSGGGGLGAPQPADLEPVEAFPHTGGAYQSGDDGGQDQDYAQSPGGGTQQYDDEDEEDSSEEQVADNLATSGQRPVADPRDLSASEAVVDLDSLDIFDDLDDYVDLDKIDVIQDVQSQPEEELKTAGDELRELIKGRIKQAADIPQDSHARAMGISGGAMSDPAKAGGAGAAAGGGMSSKFVGGKAKPEGAGAPAAPPPGFMPKIPPEIRRHCLILGVGIDEVTSPNAKSVVMQAWKNQIASPGVHPDLGGDTEAAVLLNTAKDQLVRWIEQQAPKLGKKFGKPPAPPPTPPSPPPQD